MMRELCLSMVLLLLPAALRAGTGNDVIEASGVKGGLVVHVGCGSGELTAGLCAGDSFVVQGLAADPADVKKARRYISSEGLYGRVSARHWDGKRLPYADGLVNLVVCSAPGMPCPADELARVLAPGGVAVLGRPVNSELPGLIRQRATVEDWFVYRKPVPPEIDEWTHWLYGPDGNAVGKDRVVGPPRHMQWVAKPFWARLHDAPSTTSAMVSSNGRLFYIVDEGPSGIYARHEEKWLLVARDAINGVQLWKKHMPDWGWKKWVQKWHARNNQPFQLPKRLVAVGDTVYVTLGFDSKLSALDAATGRVTRTYEGTERTDEILYRDGLLVLSLGKSPLAPSSDGEKTVRKSVAVLNADTGKILWNNGDFSGVRAKTNSSRPLSRLELAVGGDKVFLSDHDAIVALDLKTGREIWRTARPKADTYNANFSTLMSELTVLVYSDGVVLFAQPQGGKSFHSVPGNLHAFGADDGSPLWERRYGGWVHNNQPNVFVVEGLVWIHEHLEIERGRKEPANRDRLEYAVLGLDLRTGEEKKRLATKKILNVGHHHRCYRNKATERYLLMSRRGVEFVDLESGENHLHHWTRGDCHTGVMPCNGLLYITPHPCGCYIDTKLNGYFALAPASPRGDRTPDHADVVKGPAFGDVGQPSAPSWSTFRSSPARGGFLKARVPAAFKKRWEAELGGAVGPLTIAGGKVFVPVVDEHRVVALNASDGTQAWAFTAGARVDTPPTLYKGMALFGSADGRVYSLRASDGELAWARRVAPRDEFMGSMGQIESRWPVHGSILIQDGLAYLAAGRSSYLDGGIFLYVLEPETGDIIERKVVYSADPEAAGRQARQTFDIEGMLPDILVGDGAAVWMRRQAVFGTPQRSSRHVHATGGFRDDTWFNRTTWAAGALSHAQFLVFDDTTGYGIESFPGTGRATAFTAGAKGYRLTAKSLMRNPGSQSAGRDRKGEKKRKKDSGRKRPSSPALWSRYVDIRATAMAVSDGTLYLAGAPDRAALSAFEGKDGMVLCAISTSDGKEISRCELEALPVWDGMALAEGALFLATRSGKVLCLTAAR